MAFHLSTHASLLARLANDGGDSVWREFHDRYHGLVHSFARARGLQPMDADDVTQEVLLAVHEKIKEFEYDPARGRFRGFLKTIALRAIWSRQADGRGERNLSGAEPRVDENEMEAQWESEWRQYHLGLATSVIRLEFPPTEFEAFEMLTSQGRSVTDTAAATGIPVNRVYRVRAAIMERLRRLIAMQVAEEG